jgi:phosphate/sulfate permease
VPEGGGLLPTGGAGVKNVCRITVRHETGVAGGPLPARHELAMKLRPSALSTVGIGCSQPASGLRRSPSDYGQNSIGLIMLTIIGIMPAAFSVNPEFTSGSLPAIIGAADQAVPLIQKYGDDEKRPDGRRCWAHQPDPAKCKVDAGSARRRPSRIAGRGLSRERGTKHRIGEQSRHHRDKALAKQLHDTLHGAVEYAPTSVRMLSTICLGLGTMVGYKRIVITIGERIGI